MFSSSIRRCGGLGRALSSTGRRAYCMEPPASVLPNRVPQGYEKSMNHVLLVGRAGAAAQLRGSEQHPVVQFPLATSSHYNSPDGEVTQSTVWHNISVFAPGLRDSLLKSVKKGQRVMVSGKVTYFERTDATGAKLSNVSVVANDVVMFKPAAKSQ